MVAVAVGVALCHRIGLNAATLQSRNCVSQIKQALDVVRSQPGFRGNQGIGKLAPDQIVILFRFFIVFVQILLDLSQRKITPGRSIRFFMFFDNIRVPFQCFIELNLMSQVLGQLQLDARYSLGIVFFRKQVGECFDGFIVILKQLVGFSQLESRLGFEIFIRTLFNGISKNLRRLAIFLEAYQTLGQTIKRHRLDELIVRVLCRFAVFICGKIISALFVIETAKLISRLFPKVLVDVIIAGDLAELFFGPVEIFQA